MSLLVRVPSPSLGQRRRHGEWLADKDVEMNLLCIAVSEQSGPVQLY